jgi:hypothetical protein
LTIAQRLAIATNPPVEAPAGPAPVTVVSRPRVLDTPGVAPPATVRAAATEPIARTSSTADVPPAADALNVARATREVSAGVPYAMPAPPPVREAVATPLPAPASVPAAATRAGAPNETTEDSGLVRRALQRYRDAYEGLDARSAQEVWPAVNQTALARAFDGLLSQSLTFDTCDVNLRGEAATATCRGSARYVTKVGSRDPRVEARVWNFRLHKTGSDWQIDSARAER